MTYYEKLTQISQTTHTAWQDLRKYGECFIEEKQIGEINFLSAYYSQPVKITSTKYEYIVKFA